MKNFFLVAVIALAMFACKSAPEVKPQPKAKPVEVVKTKPEPVVEEPAPVTHDEAGVVYFAPLSVQVDASMRGTLDRILSDLENSNMQHIRITGHTALLDSSKEAQRIALKRAIAVADYLIAHGLKKKIAIAIEGSGFDNPAASHAEMTSRFLNRRVEIAY